MQLQLLKSYAESIELRDASADELEEDGVTLLFTASVDKENSKHFLIQFDIALNLGGIKHLNIKHSSLIEADIELAEMDIDSPLFKVNGPAIAFPFLRSYIAQVTLLSGYEPVILPTKRFSM